MGMSALAAIFSKPFRSVWTYTATQFLVLTLYMQAQVLHRYIHITDDTQHSKGHDFVVDWSLYGLCLCVLLAKTEWYWQAHCFITAQFATVLQLSADHSWLCSMRISRTRAGSLGIKA